jgi:hypothetical protein
VSLFIYIFFGLAALLLVVFAWALRRTRSTRATLPLGSSLEENGCRHVNYLPQLQQALARTDEDYLVGTGVRGLQRRVRRERQRVALAYLNALRGDFQSLLRTARIIAVLSPEVAAVQELERLRLSVQFAWRYQMIRMKLLAGLAPLPQLNSLGDLISGLSVRMETAMKELGERAALAAELASSLNRRGVGPG